MFTLDSMGIDINQLSSTIDLVFTILFASVLLILALCFVRGLFRGWKRGTYNLIFFLILVTVALLTLNPISSLLGTSVDLSSITNTNTATINIDDMDITFTVSTLQATLTDFFTELFKAMGMSASPNDIVNYSTALSSSLIKLILLFIDTLLILTLGSFFVFLLWHLLFKRFTPKEKRKKKTLRLVSAFEEVIIGGVALAMLLTPFTGIVNALTNNAKLEKDEAEKNETTQLAYAAIESYKNSIFSNVFFSWSVKDGENTLDTKLLSFLTSSEAGDVKVDVASQVGEVATVASYVINSGLLSAFGGKELSWRLLLGGQAIPSLLSSISDMEIIKIALPVALSIALNMGQLKDTLGEDTVNYLSSSNVDWSNELKNLSNIYIKLIDADFFNVLIDEETKTPVFDLSYIFDIFEEEKNQKAMHEMFTLADNEIVNHVLAGLVYTMSSKEEKDDDPQTLQLIDFLPKEKNGELNYSSLSSFSWFNELRIIYDSFYSLVQIDREQMKYVFDGFDKRIELGGLNAKKNAEANSSSSADNIINEEVKNRFVSFIAEHPNEIATPLVGDLNNIDENGLSKGETKCLFDSELLKNALPELLPFIQASIDPNKENFNLDEANKDLVNNGNIRKNFKKEFDSIINVLGDIASNEEGKAFIKDVKDMPGFNFDPDGNLYSINENLIDAICKGVRNINDSKIFQVIIPSYIKNSLDENQAIKEFLPEGFDFELGSELGSELAYLLSLVKKCPNLIRNISNSKGGSINIDQMLNLVEENGNELVEIIDTVCNSKILNPGLSNENVASLFNKLGSFISSDSNIFGSEDINNVREIGQGALRKEIENLIDVFSKIASSGVADSLSSLNESSTSESIKVLSSLNVKEVFESIDNSIFMKKLAASAFDGYLTPIIGGAELGLENISFKNVKDWKKEGEGLQAIIDLATKGVDLSNVDFFSNGDLLSTLLAKLAESEMFVDKESGDYLFPEYLYKKLVKSLDISSLSYFADKDVDLTLVNSFEDKLGVTTLLRKDMLSREGEDATSFRNRWINENDGEISKLGDILSSISSIGGLDGLTNLSSSSINKIGGVLDKVAKSSSFGRVLIYNGLKEAFANIPESSFIDFKKANFNYFLFDENAPYAGHEYEASDEISLVVEIISLFYDDTYGIVNNSAVDVSQLDIESISIDFFLKPILLCMKDSKLFGITDTNFVNSLNPVASKEEGRGTVFGDLVCTLVKKSKMYDYFDIESKIDSKLNNYTNKTIIDLVNDTSDWDKEIDNICNVLSLVKDSPLLDKDPSTGEASINFDILQNPASFFGDDETLKEIKKNSLKELLYSVSDSSLFGKAVPARIEKMLFSNPEHSNINHVVGGEGWYNGFVWAADPYFTKQGDDYSPYSHDEIDHLIDMLYYLSYSADLSTSNLNTIDPINVTKALDSMMRSGIFNSKAADDSNLDIAGMTSFQIMMKTIIGADAFNEYFYNASNPDDANATLVGYYNDASSKAKYFAKKYFKGNYLNKAEMDNQSLYLLNSSYSLETFYTSLKRKALACLIDSNGANINFDDLDENSLSLLFHTFDNCIFYEDIVPNCLDVLLAKSSYKIDGIDLKKANCFIKYLDGYDKSRWSNELDLVSSLIVMIRDNKNILDASTKQLNNIDPLLLRSILVDMSESDVFHYEGRAVSSKTNLDITTNIENGELVFNDLTVFEQLMYKIYKVSGLAKKAFSISTDPYEINNPNGDLVKLHSRIKSFSSLGGLNNGDWHKEISHLTYGYDKAKQEDYGLIYDCQSNGLLSGGTLDVSEESIKKMSPANLSKLFRDMNYLDVTKDALSNVVSSLLTSGVGLSRYSTVELSYSSGNNMDFSSYFKEEASPSISKITFKADSKDFAINYVNDSNSTLNDFLNNDTYVSFDGTYYSINTKDLRTPFKISGCNFSEVKFSLDTASYTLSQTQLKENDIDALYLLLDSLYDNTKKEYFDFSKTIDEGGVSRTVDFRDFIGEGHSTSGLLNLLEYSNLYKNHFEYDGSNNLNLVNGSGFESRALTFFNILNVTESFSSTYAQASIASNFAGDDYTSKLNVITSIWDNGIIVNDEADWFDKQIFSSGYLEAYMNYSSSSLHNFALANALLGQTMSTKEKNIDLESYLATTNSVFGKEILSGQLNKLMDLNIAYIKDPSFNSLSYPSVSRNNYIDSLLINVDFKSNDYVNLGNDYINQIKSMMSLIHHISLGDYESAKNLLNGFDSYEDKSILDKVYLGSIYDLLVAKSKFAFKKNDFVYVNNKDGGFKNFLNSIDSNPNSYFSYSNVASLL